MWLLDTCTLIWLAAEKPELSAKARTVIESNPDTLFVSAASALEIAVKARNGKLKFGLPPGKWYDEALKAFQIHEIPVDSRVAFRVGLLSPIHNDPFDRLIIATALLDKLVVITCDRQFRRYKEVKTVW